MLDKTAQKYVFVIVLVDVVLDDIALWEPWELTFLLIISISSGAANNKHEWHANSLLHYRCTLLDMNGYWSPWEHLFNVSLHFIFAPLTSIQVHI